MTSSDKIHARGGYKWIVTLLFAFAISLLNANEARAQSDGCVAAYGGVIDGKVNPVPPAHIQIDGNCTIRNFPGPPVSTPFTSNISFYGNNPTSWLVIFDNVMFTGNMSCNLNSQGNVIWFTNGSSSTLKASCLNLLIPVEKINKQNPPGQTTAAVGIPFTYKLTIPVLFDPATGTVSNANGSPNDLHGITVWDDLNATGADLSYVSHDVYWLNSNGTRGGTIQPTFSNVGGVLTFDNFPVVTALRQFVIEVTVVLNDNPTKNVPGKQFINTAKWDFGRLINGVYYEPLPGEWGVSPPMTIAAPVLVVDKSGPATMNLGQWGNFAIDVQNTGTSDAWNATIRDLLPDGATGGMCDLTPEILSAQVFAADGVTPVPGKGPLNPGSGYSLSYSAASNCQLEITLLTAAGTIGPNERLIIRYRTKLDTNTLNGVTLTNIAGAIQWFTGDSSNPNRKSSTRTLTNGTPGVLDYEDAHTVTVALSGNFFEKTVADLTSGVNPATTAAPGDKLRYTLRFRTTTLALSNFRIVDELDALNAQPDFAPGTLTLVASPAGADISATSNTGGTKGTGVIDIRNLSLPASGEAVIQFDITLASTLSNGTVVTNQSTLRLSDGTVFALSDDPNVNGAANPAVSGDEDSTRVTIASASAFRVQKISRDLTGDPNVLLPGDTLRYSITVTNIGNVDAMNVILRDAVPPNTTYVADSTTLNGPAVADVAGLSPLVNGMLINSPSNTTPGSIPANPSSQVNCWMVLGIPYCSLMPTNAAIITFDVVVNANVAGGTVISNQGFVTAAASGIVNQPSDDPDTPAPNDPTLDIVSGLAAPVLTVTKSGPPTMNLGQWGNFTIDVQNTGLGDAWNVSLRDVLPDGATGGMCDLTPEILSAQVFASDGVTPVPGKGPLNSGSDYSLSYSAAPNCQLNVTMLTAAGRIGPNERMIIRYRTQLDNNTQNGVTLTNIAGAIQWFNADNSNPNRQSSTRTLTNGTPGVLDHEDAHTVTTALTGYFFEKTAANLTSGVNPTTAAAPGDKLRYTLRVRTTDQPLTNFRISDDLGVLNAGPAFLPGTLTLGAYPAGADVSGTSSTGGTNGTGIIDIRNLNLPVNSAVVIQFDITLASSLSNGTVVTNQSTLTLTNGTVVPSDDPNVNGTARSDVLGDENPTKVTIVSAAGFLVQKISTDLTGDPNVLLAGETLRYTITVKNTGNANAVNVMLRDAVPVNTTYVAGSTTLNGAAVPDSGGQSALVSGMPINSPADTTPGSMPANASSGQTNVATITFDVVVNPNAANGTVISNQGFVTAAASGIVNQPSDDPDTPTANDPTLDIVGNLPVIFEKTAANLTSGVNPTTTAAPGDKLRYTLRVRTTNQALTNFRISDDLGVLNAGPAFVPGTLTLGASPAGADVSGTSSTGGTNGTGIIDIRNLNVPVNNEVVIQFDITLASSLSNGTVVTNQSTLTLANGTVTSSDDPNVTGTANPTKVTIVSAAGFLVQKISTDLTGDPNVLLAGETLRYSITVKNTGNANAVNVMLRDAVPVNTTYVAGSTTLNGAAVPDSGGQSALVSGMPINSPADTTPGSMPANASSGQTNVATITFDVVVNPNAANGTVISNQGFVTAAASGIVNQPSDDPDTPTANDPTLDIVGNLPVIFEKTAANLTSGVNPTTTAAPGDKLRYTLRVRTTNQALTNFRISDDLGVLNAGPAFVPGTLTLGASPAGADVSGTSSTGGTNGTGIIDIRNLNVPVNNEVVIQFDITLASSLSNGTVVTNQSTLTLANGTVTSSDDPNVTGTANPTKVTIVSAAGFLVQKISTDLTGDPNVLLAGETLRYSITVKNTGNANAVNVTLRDAVPVNTTYVAGSTTLNGVPVPDSGGQSALVNGMPINSPADTTPGSMPANASSGQTNVATITFDVVVNPNAANGTVISNQGFVTAAASGIVDHPSDDPDTPAANDPTLDIVGNLPLLYAEKQVALFGDLGSPGIVDPGDVLRYTITVQNSAAIPATGVVLRDTVPANTTYVANSTLLDGLPVGQPDGGVSPLASGININSISPKATAVLQFDLRVNAGTPAGTVISNQAVVESVELPDLLTDGDGNPATGPEPTVIVVGNGQQLSITNQVVVVGGGAAVPGAQLEYVVNVVNIAAVPAINAVITDDLNGSQPGQLTYVNGSASLNGTTAGVTFAGSTITVNYGAVSGPLPPGEALVLRFRATLKPNLALGTVVTNTSVATWNNPTQTASSSVSITVGSFPGSNPAGFAVLNGSVWHDADFDNVRDSGERALAGWAVELYRDNQLSQSVLTDANGIYSISGVEPNDVTGLRYELRFSAPGAGANTAMLGRAVSPFTNGLQRISDIIVPSGANLQGLNLRIDPNGVIYNTLTRIPVVGATLTLLDARSRSPLPASCFDDVAQQGQVTLADGYYKFDTNFGNPACPSGGDYLISVAPPTGPTYVAGTSQIIPPASGPSSAAFSVPACPASVGDAIPGTATFCEVQPSEFAPAASVPPRSAGTIYHVHVRLDGTQMPGTSQIFNNHIPLDPQVTGSLSITKTTPLLNVTRGQLVPYVITVNNRGGTMFTDVSILDYLPAGFTYVVGSALLDGVPTEPSIAGRTLSWNGLAITGTQERTVKLLVNVGAGVTAGDFVNRAQLMNAVSGNALSGEATATVRLTPDPTFDCTDVIGKVFNDANRNGLQDNGEDGLRGVRVVTAQGLQATTDSYGRYHITCAITPNESRGSNFVLKLDDRTLPSGFRLTTDQVQIKRATGGKDLKINFGASIHRVVGIDLSDAAFMPGTTEIREQWQPRLNLLLEELRKAPAVLRLSYVADTEDAALVQRRVESVKRELTKTWDQANHSNVLTIEPEVFWRRGAPPKRPDVRVPGSK